MLKFIQLSRVCISIGFFSLLLMGCGQSGPLYLPAPEVPAAEAPVETATCE